MLALTAALILAASSSDPIRVAPGAQEVIRVGGLTRVALGKPEVADVTLTGKGELLVLGKQQGRTSLILWTTSGMQTRTIVVDDGRSSELSRMIKELVSPGLKVETYNGQIVVDGTLDSIDELRRLKALVSGDSNVKLLVHLNPRVLPIVAEQITGAFRKEGIRDARATCVGQRIFLEGSVADEKELQKALLIADAFYGLATNGLGTP